MGTRYHAFLSHKSSDKPAVEQLALRMDEKGIACWLDKWHLVPGEGWQPAIAKALNDCNTCVVFIGRQGFGSWQHEEMQAAIDRRVNDETGFRVIPVLLPGAAKPKDLPTFLTAHTWVEFQSLADEEALRRLIAGIRGIAPGPGVGREADQTACPYRGLETFGEEHSRFFFGRKELVKRILGKLERQLDSPTQRRFLAIIGASGSGKSSLARAGVIPALKAGKIPESSEWPVITCRPGYDPAKEIAVALASQETTSKHVQDVARFINGFRRNPETLDLTVSVAFHGSHESQRLFVLVDQFEELFTLCAEEDLRRATIDNLLHAATVPGGKTHVLLTMRADFYPKCASYAVLRESVSDHHELVGPMSDEELRDAVEQPARTVGCDVEPALVEMLLDDMKKQPTALPLLQHALRECWNRREGTRLTIGAYQAIGRLEGAVTQHADALYETLDLEEQKACQGIFLRLTQPGEGTEDTKRLVFRDDLGINPTVDRVILKLVQGRLVTTWGTENPSDSSVEISHEALIRGWSRLRAWLEADRENLLIQHRVIYAAREWMDRGKDSSFLYRGARLSQAEEWSTKYADRLGQWEQEFLSASIKGRQAEKRIKMANGLIAVASIVAIALAATWYLSYQGLSRTHVELRRQQNSLEELQNDLIRQSRALERLSEYLRRDIESIAATEQVIQQQLEKGVHDVTSTLEEVAKLNATIGERVQSIHFDQVDELKSKTLDAISHAVQEQRQSIIASETQLKQLGSVQQVRSGRLRHVYGRTAVTLKRVTQFNRELDRWIDSVQQAQR